ncbi:MAG: hypothetical protein WD034_13420 [Parvibaculum sp.]|uniref:hypothetical protein n=1 Tax=Parvibaculum sp. TaxID=2024848 RepID=UPI00349FF9CF
MNRMLREWLHQAAFAAAAFSGQPYWVELVEVRQDVPEKVKQNKPLSGFGPALRAAD